MRLGLRALGGLLAFWLATRHALGPVHFAMPYALALLALLPLRAPLRALSLAALAFALAEPTYRPDPGRPWQPVHARDGDLEAAVQRAAAELPDGGRIALTSDGRERHGSLLRAASELAQRRIAIYYAYVEAPPELALTAFESSPLAQPLALEATVAASEPALVHIELAEHGHVISRADQQLPAGESVLHFEPAAAAGEALYQLTLTPRGPDTDLTNNSLTLRVRASDRPRVLLLDSEPARTDAFSTLLRAGGFELATRASELEACDFVILSDMPARALAPAFQQALGRYLRAGGGLLVAGGEHAFGPGGYRGTTLERLLPVTLDGADARNEASLALVLAIDKSGSMAGDKLERAKEAALATAALLPEDAYLGVLGFDVEATRIARLARAHADLSAVTRLSAGGGTALFPALDAAYADLAAVRAQLKHVVMLTDGQTQEEALGDLVRAMHADGITLSMVGLGDDVQRGLLGELAKLAGGRAYFTRDPSQVPRLFVEEAERVARSLVVERALRVEARANAAFLRGVPLADAPPLRGLVSTGARTNTLVLEAGGEPLLARMRVGEGWSLAWTSDLKPRWSAAWFAWPGQALLFAQLIREHMRRPDTLALRSRWEDGLAVVECEQIDPHGRFVNGLTGTARVGERAAPFEQVAPGRYVARVPARPGDVLHASLGDQHGRSAVPHGRFELGSGRALLEEAARRTGGGPLTRPAQVAAPPPDTARRLWPPALWLALASFLFDVARRRLLGQPGA